MQKNAKTLDTNVSASYKSAIYTFTFMSAPYTVKAYTDMNTEV